jgi:hypothetical protein
MARSEWATVVKVVIDVDSGTWLDAEKCRIIDIPTGKEGMLEEISDNERSALAEAWGYPVVAYKEKGDRK